MQPFLLMVKELLMIVLRCQNKPGRLDPSSTFARWSK